jgi:sugar phosphate isomerase/epimerase
MKIGVSNYTWSWAVGVKGYEPKNPLDSIGLLQKAKNNHVSVLQIVDNPCLHEMSEEELERVSSVADEFGVTLEIGTRGIEPDHLMKYLNIAKKLKSKLIRTLTHRLDDEAASWIKEVLPSYEDAGVAIALENHDEHPTKELAGFLDSIGSSLVGVCLDTVNSFAALEQPKLVLKNLAPHALSLHVKDFDIVRVGHQLGFSIEGRPAGEGRLDVKWIVDYLKNMRKDPNAILELWTPFTKTVEETIKKEEEWAVKSLKYLRSIIK